MAEQIWTVGSILKWTEQYFREHGVESPRLDAEVLLSFVLKKERIYLYVHFDEPLVKEELAKYREMVKKRVARMPVAYIIGKRDFMGYEFKVSPAVLVPRPETEILVQTVLENLPEGKNLVADIGTGSGAIAIALALENADLSVRAVDISSEALAVAQENSRTLAVSERVEFILGDLLAPLQGNRYRALISNPPYIPQADMEILPPEVKEYEPERALFGGIDGLDIYRRLTAGSGELLEPGGFLAVEVGINEAVPVAELAKNAGFCRTQIIKDYAGIDRVVVAWKE